MARGIIFCLSWLIFSAVSYGKSQVNGYLGYGPAGLGFAVDYQMKWDKYTNWGAYVHNFSASDEAVGGTAIGGFYRPHFKRGPYRFRLTLGVGIFNLETPVESKSAFGPVAGFGLSKKLTKQVDLGFESYSYYGWFSEPTGKIFEAAMFMAAYKL